LAVWERVQRKGRAARTTRDCVGVYYHPDTEIPLDSRFKVSPEYIDSSFVLVRLLGLDVPSELETQVDPQLKVRSSSASDLNWLFSRYQLGFSFSMMSGDSRISAGTSVSELKQAFYCFVMVAAPVVRRKVETPVKYLARAYSCLYESGASHPTPGCHPSPYSAPDIDRILSRLRKSQQDTTPVVYTPSSFYIATECRDELHSADLESYLQMISRNLTSIGRFQRDGALKYFSAVLKYMNECAFNRAVSAELLEMAAHSQRMNAAQSRVDVARWKADLLSWDYKWCYARDLTSVFDDHGYDVSVTAISRADVVDRAFTSIPNSYLQSWRDVKPPSTSKQITDSIPVRTLFLERNTMRPAITFKDKLAPGDYAATLSAAPKSSGGWGGFSLRARTWHPLGGGVPHSRNDSGSSSSSSSARITELPNDSVVGDRPL